MPPNAISGSAEDGDHTPTKATSAIASVLTPLLAAPIDLEEGGHHQYFVSARCTQSWPTDSGTIQAHQPAMRLWRYGVLGCPSQEVPGCCRVLVVPTPVGWESSFRSCPKQFEAVRDPRPPQANPQLPRCHPQRRASEPADRGPGAPTSTLQLQTAGPASQQEQPETGRARCATQARFPPSRLWCALEDFAAIPIQQS